MTSEESLDRALGIEALRAGFLQYTREAYARLPPLDRPCLLDVGCGSGLPTIELARLTGGRVVGLDTDPIALGRLRERAAEAGLDDQILAVRSSVREAGLAGGRFDVLWDEGVLHLFDPADAFPECRRLLRPGGWLVMNETLAWLDRARDRLSASGFTIEDRLPLPEGCWWIEYYAPLQARLRACRARGAGASDEAHLARYEREVAMVEADPRRFDCAFVIARSASHVLM